MRRRWLGGLAALIALVLAGFVASALLWSGATLAGDAVALARVQVQPFGGTVEQVRAFGPGGRRIPIAVHDDKLTPRTRLVPGEPVTVDVVVRRPGWLSWLIGSLDRERLTLRAPAAHLRGRWLTVSAGAPERVGFDQPVSSVAYGAPGSLRYQTFARPRRSLSVGQREAAGTVEVASAARPWEGLGRFEHITWFPASRSPSVVASPAPGARVAPSTPLRLTFSKPVAEVLGSARPTLAPRTPGHWREVDTHTLVFNPSGYGAGLGTRLRAELPHRLDLVKAGGALGVSRSVGWTVPPGSTLRLQQLLAEAGYLPLDWKPARAAVDRTVADEVHAAVNPPAGSFSWRYQNVPKPLRSLWAAGQSNEITRGALMAFENDHGLDVDGVAGPEVWHTLLVAAIAGKRSSGGGYSYVFVQRNLPQSLTLWHDGHTIITSPANTGIASAPTATGTYPVFEHIPDGTMSGTNPDGSHYSDPGIRWISYFNGGDAVHAFDRASFGTPQSLGCVELPLASAAKVWPYTPIGTLVTIG